MRGMRLQLQHTGRKLRKASLWRRRTASIVGAERVGIQRCCHDRNPKAQRRRSPGRKRVKAVE